MTTTQIEDDQENAEQWRWPEGLHFVRYPVGLRQKIKEKGLILWECLAEAAGSDPLTFIKQDTIEQRCGLNANQQNYWAKKLCNLHDDDGRPYLEVIQWASGGMIKGCNVYVLYPFVGMVPDSYIKQRRKYGQRYKYKAKPLPDVAAAAPSPAEPERKAEPEPEWATEARRITAMRAAEYEAMERLCAVDDDDLEMADSW
jgi:hypothetical protein